MSEIKTTLSKNAQTIQDFLAKQGLKCAVIELSASTHTANQAAAVIGCEVAQIVKSLLLRTKETNQPVLVLASGANRVNEKEIEKNIGEKIVKADANFTKEITGFSIGGVPPIGHKQTLKTFIDEDLLKFSELWAAAGTANAVFNIHSQNLLSLTGGTIIPIK